MDFTRPKLFLETDHTKQYLSDRFCQSGGNEKMPKQLRPIRLLAIVKLMEQRENTSMTRMTRLLKCSKRTIYRDIGLLKKAGVPIRLRHDRYRINKTAWAKLKARDLLRKR